MGKPIKARMFLSNLYPYEILTDIIKPLNSWHPFPKVEERDAWEVLPIGIRTRFINQGHRFLKKTWPTLPADIYLLFSRIGNRSQYETLYFQRREILLHLILAELMEAQGIYLESIANAVWSICEESSWCIPAHIGMQKAGLGLPDIADPYIDLFAAETSAILAWTFYFLDAELCKISPLIPRRIIHEIKTRILDPALARDDFWWMGFTDRSVNNWNPWINSNWLASLLLVEADQSIRIQSVAKILRSLDRFITTYPEDGGCDEGPAYWGVAGASLFDCLELLNKATGGIIDVYDRPLIQEIGRFIYRAHISDDYYVNFADAPACLTPTPTLIFEYGKRIHDTKMVSFGAWVASRSGLLKKGSVGSLSNMRRVVAGLFVLGEIATTKPRCPLLQAVWLDQIQVASGRDEADSRQGLYFAAKGGHNDESHNHNDVGHFIVYKDGKPLIIDVGVETYTRKTFSTQRYEIWTMQSAYHSLPTIDGVMQSAGKHFAARDVRYEANNKKVRFSLDIAKAYSPEAKLKSWVRYLTLHRRKSIQLVDTYEFLEPPKDLTLSLMTPCRLNVSIPGEIHLLEAPLAGQRKSGTGLISYDKTQLTVVVEVIPIKDEELRAVWGSQLRRILFTILNISQQGSLEIMIS